MELSPRLAQTLASHAEGALTVLAAGSERRYHVKAASKIGGFATPELTVLVRPKAGLENTFAMLGVVLSSFEWNRDRQFLTSSSGLLEATIHMYAASLETALRLGHDRDYVARRAAERALRGRPDFARMMSAAGLAFPIACSFTEFTDDSDLNRFLCAALRSCQRVPGLTPLAMRRLRRLEASFARVEPTYVDPRWDEGWEPTRLNERFESAARLAGLILRNLSLRDRAGGAPVAAFWLDMNEVFELWVTKELRGALRGFGRVEAQTWTHLDNERRVGMRPDIVITIDGQAVAVADCKYKLVAGEGRNPDYYQALAYATALGLPAAALIYARLPGAEEVAPLSVRETPIVLHTLGIDLSRPVAELRDEVRVLAAELRNVCAPARSI